MAPPLAVLVGPTGSGKTYLALAIARHLPIEVVVADSRQVYRGMDIGTAKPNAAERAGVPHHMLDLVAPDEPFTLADWLAEVRRLLPAISQRGRLPLLVGGTGLYVNALLDGYQLEHQPPAPDLRRRLVDELEAEGLAALAERLRRRAPQIAARTDLHNPRRVLRALERTDAGGGGAVPAAAPYPGRVVMLGLQRPRDVLAARIDDRARRMFTEGLLDEVRGLLQAGYGPDLPPLTGHGYREAMRVLAGEWPLERAVEVTARHTRQYAKRQQTWFRRERRIAWLDAGAGPSDDPALVASSLDLLRRMLGT